MNDNIDILLLAPGTKLMLYARELRSVDSVYSYNRILVERSRLLCAKYMASAKAPNIRHIDFRGLRRKPLKHCIMRWWCLDCRGDGSWVVPRLPSCLQSCCVLV